MELKDKKARDQIEKNLEANILVEAGAGSGKTTSLVKRMANLIINNRCRVEEMAAITFTRKAAAELREKFQDELEKSYNTREDPRVKELLGEALMNLDRSFLGTIHSFCSRLLRERPVEAGIDPAFKELDDLQEVLVVEEAWREYLTWVKLNRQDLLDPMEEMGVSPEALEGLYHTFCQYPEVQVPVEAVPLPDFKSSLKNLESLVEEALEYIPYPPHEDRYDSLQDRIRQARRMYQNLDLEQPANAMGLLSLFEKIPKITLKLWVSKEDAKEIQEKFQNFSSSQALPLIQGWREYCYYHICNFLLPGREFLKEYKEERSVLGFHDLLMKTREMLREYPEVRNYFQDKYRCLLVDEFQDTDPLQSEIMFCLTGREVQEKNWQKLTPLPGSLFVVGDPKQSIYRFRRADIDTYNLAKKLIKEKGGEILSLTTNFRCLKPLGEFCNGVFEKLLALEENRYQALFTPIDAWRREEEDTHYGVRLLKVGEGYGKKEEIVEQDARQVAAFVRYALGGNIKLARSREEKEKGLTEVPRPGDFLVVLSYKEMMETYARALEEEGIPVAMTGGSSLGSSLELKELLKLLKYLHDPDNQVLLVAVLKGLFFGFSDDDLYQFKRQGGRFNPFASLPREMEEAPGKYFQEAFQKLKKYIKWKGSCPPPVVLEKIIEDLGLIPLALSSPLGERNCSYLYQVLEYARQKGLSSPDPFLEMVKQVEDLMSINLEEELDLEVADGERLRLMNLHKAKGLEAPVVILANPYKRVDVKRDSIDRHIERTGEEPRGYFSFTRKRGYRQDRIAQPPSWDYYAQEEERFLQSEKIRLLYVAATRAKNLLVISTCEKDPSMRYNSWREIIENAEEGSMEEILLPGEAFSKEGEEREKGKDGEEVKGNGAGEKIPAGSKSPAVFQESLREWLEKAAAPGWKMVQPSEIRIERKGAQELQGEDYSWQERAEKQELSPGLEGGREWGNVMHRALEGLVKGEPLLEELIKEELDISQLPAEYLDKVLGELEAFKNTPLGQEIQEAGREKHTEVPFSLNLREGDYLHEMIGKEYPGSLPILVSGVIDLVYRGEKGWVIVDYKTDGVADKGELNRLLDKYAPQVHIYAHAWEELSGEKVERGELFFLDRKASFPVYP